MKLHPLDGAFERVNRAGEHLADLKGRIREVEDVQENRLLDELDLDAPNKADFALSPRSRVVGVMMQPILPLRLSVLVGEACYNLRSALEYLAHELAKHDSGSPQVGIQFPIEDDPQRFARRKNPADRICTLRGIDPTHIAAIERLQPYNGCEWTRRLRDISNPDRHRELTATVGYTHSRALVQAVPFNNRRPERRARGAGQEVYVQFPVTLSVLLADGTPVIQTLEEIQFQVAETLQAFKPEF